MRESYAELLHQLTTQYNQGRITLASFRLERDLLLNAAEAQFNSAPSAGEPAAEDPAVDPDVTAIQFPARPQC